MSGHLGMISLNHDSRARENSDVVIIYLGSPIKNDAFPIENCRKSPESPLFQRPHIVTSGNIGLLENPPIYRWFSHKKTYNIQMGKYGKIVYQWWILRLAMFDY